MSKEPNQVFDLNDGFHVIKTPQKYQTSKDDLRQAFKCLTMKEFLVYCASKCYSLREIANYFKTSHMRIKRVYKRACEKLAKESPHVNTL